METFKNLNDLLEKIPANRREKIEQKVEQTIAAIRLAEVRKDQKITQKELAEKLQISQSSISQLESQGDPQLSTLLRYVQALGAKLEVQIITSNGNKISLLNS